jgi:hypothetical protein
MVGAPVGLGEIAALHRVGTRPRIRRSASTVSMAHCKIRACHACDGPCTPRISRASTRGPQARDRDGEGRSGPAHHRHVMTPPSWRCPATGTSPRLYEEPRLGAGPGAEAPRRDRGPGAGRRARAPPGSCWRAPPSARAAARAKKAGARDRHPRAHRARQVLPGQRGDGLIASVSCPVLTVRGR